MSPTTTKIEKVYSPAALRANDVGFVIIPTTTASERARVRESLAPDYIGAFAVTAGIGMAFARGRRNLDAEAAEKTQRRRVDPRIEHRLRAGNARR